MKDLRELHHFSGVAVQRCLGGLYAKLSAAIGNPISNATLVALSEHCSFSHTFTQPEISHL